MKSAVEFLLVDQLRPDWWWFTLVGRNGWPAARIPRPGTSVKVIRNLIQWGDDLGQRSDFLPSLHELLNRVVPGLCKGATEDGLQLVETLVPKGVDITETYIEAAVEECGTGSLSWLRSKVKDFSVKAARALAIAAAMNNFEAVEFLLQSGVDANAFIDAKRAYQSRGRTFVVRNLFTHRSPEKVYSVLAVAVAPQYINAGCSFGMVRYLAERGAQLVVGPNDSTAFAFTTYLLEHRWCDTELFDKIQFVLSILKQSEQWTNPPSHLLELSVGLRTELEETGNDRKQRLRMFEYLLHQGAELSPGSPLGALVRFGSPKELVERVLHLGAQVDAYTAVSYSLSPFVWTPLQAAASRGNEDLVKLLLTHGANINSPPRGAGGKTALQHICYWSPATEEQHRRKMRICNLLIHSGADINAPAARRYGMTTLQATVIQGDLELAAILIRNGAHVNAPPAEIGSESGYHYCALDAAAFHGRLDIAKLLLNCNAFSIHRGKTGYDGAIEIACSRGHHAIASLIREHPRKGVDSIPLENHQPSGYETDDDYWTEWDEESVEGSVHSADQDSSELDAAGNAPSESNVLVRYDPNTSEDTQESPAFQDAGTALVDDLTSNLGTRVDLTEDDLQITATSTGSFAEMFEAQAWQVTANSPTDERTSHLDTGFILPADDAQLPEIDWMLQNPSEAWAGVPDDSALWQQVFDKQEEEFGLEKFDEAWQLPWSDPLGEPCVDGEDEAQRELSR